MTPIVFACLAGLIVGFFLGWILCSLITANGPSAEHFCPKCGHHYNVHDYTGCQVNGCGCPNNFLHYPEESANA